VIILGIDPGTAALGYGIVERQRDRLRAVDYGCVETTPTCPSASGC
jgi:crossover junction endodeoxyribonuclease RuvC